MKKYLLFSVLSFTLVFLLIELIMSNKPGFVTYAGFNWFINPDLISWDHVLTCLIQGLALSFAAFLYMNPEDKLSGGFRFGLITGLLFSIIVLFNMMWQVESNMYPFFAEGLLSLTGLYVLGFALSGWLFGLMFELFTPELGSNRDMWSLA
ncbi:MAG: hypothetical protein R3E90_04915 [Marinicella sp.]